MPVSGRVEQTLIAGNRRRGGHDQVRSVVDGGLQLGSEFRRRVTVAQQADRGELVIQRKSFGHDRDVPPKGVQRYMIPESSEAIRGLYGSRQWSKRRPTPINPGSYHTRARPSEDQVGKPASLRSGIRKNKRPPDLNPEGACRCGAPKDCDGSRGRRRLPATQWFRKPNRPKSGWRASHGSHGGTVVIGSDWLEATTLWDDGSTAAGSQ